MVTEHAITYKDKLSVEDLNYIIKKANRLGSSDRTISRVYQEEDNEGKHIYFSVDSMKEALKHEWWISTNRSNIQIYITRP